MLLRKGTSMVPLEVAEKVDQMSDDEFERHALGVLERELGVYGFARFLRVYRAGSGDYTEERHQWLGGLSVEEAMQ